MMISFYDLAAKRLNNVLSLYHIEQIKHYQHKKIIKKQKLIIIDTIMLYNIVGRYYFLVVEIYE